LREERGTTTRVAAVLAAYNRRDLTLACVRSLRGQQVPGVAVDAFALDDASSDGTAAAIAEEFPEVTLLHGDGKLYWNGGMRRAFAAAIAGDYDYYLWMNDDTELDDGALAVLLDTERQLRHQGHDTVIVAGSTRHPDTGELTYGGVVRPHRWRPMRTELVEPGDTPRPCDTMNGNATLISRAVVRRVGNIGTCASHPKRRPGEQALGDELRQLWSIKELTPRSWAVFCRRWAGRLWPLYWLSPYVRRGARLIVERAPLRRAGPVGP